MFVYLIALKKFEFLKINRGFRSEMCFESCFELNILLLNWKGWISFKGFPLKSSIWYFSFLAKMEVGLDWFLNMSYMSCLTKASPMGTFSFSSPPKSRELNCVGDFLLEMIIKNQIFLSRKQPYMCPDYKVTCKMKFRAQ